ncbi:MAG: Glutamine-dependent NAD(+) synthetase [Alphaproteobacteria bacterium ADurb.Bin438]|nr:MAG: Glutamine-dependent NAD(+) synthetase [Alphaproteobacteria bacterium ADurb.Bin438]
MKIIVGQLNSITGDIDNNFKKIEQLYKQNEFVLIHPEVVFGANIKSLCLNKDFIKKVDEFKNLILEKNKKLPFPCYFYNKPWHKNFNFSSKSYGIHLNLVGGFDECVFHGNSFIINKQGKKIYEFERFKEEIAEIEFENDDFKTEKTLNKISNQENIFNALIIGLKDYVNKSGFKKVMLGLSGGMDSAFVATLAKEAFGSENVKAYLLPSKYTSDLSNELAIKLCENFKIPYEIIPIMPMYEEILKNISKSFETERVDTTLENLQARIRGVTLMSLSNRNDAMLLATSNKSEIFAGYATLYGDTCGGFNPIKDLYKTEIFELAYWYNKRHKNKIPKEIITRPPSAELRDNQKDSDSLPEYPVFDAILKLILDKNLSFDEVVEKGFDKNTVIRILKLISNSEYKRCQAPIGTNLMKSSVYNKKLPLVNKFFIN